ncbi:hypothetical protein [Arthrobacter roseus]|uniref:hypothetical protein n=1 Tax=Arthrobacter roseus TaxID=136274 RepID=UPI001966103A|nr:hypothetical protein [Arthrobacter roseus]MBM7847505.1 hypothetical protein [Arthrobacter roseus]
MNVHTESLIAKIAEGTNKLHSRIDAQCAAIQRVRDIHAPMDAVMYAGKSQHVDLFCTGCGQDDGNWSIWPCPTIKALDEETP